MARKNTAETTETETEQYAGGYAPDGSDDGQQEEAMEFAEEDFEETLWPENKPINVYISNVRMGTIQKEGPNQGKQYLSFELVAQDTQPDPDLEHFAGQSTEVFLMKEKRNMKSLRALQMAIFGELRRSFVASDLVNQPLVVTFRHGKTRKDESGLSETPMYLESIRRDATVG